MEQVLAGSVLEWVSRSNIYLHTDLSTLKTSMSTKISDLQAYDPTGSKTFIDNVQRVRVLEIVDAYTFMCSNYLHRCDTSKAMTCNSRINQMLDLLPNFEGDLPKLNMLLRHAILSAILVKDSPDRMLEILLKHIKEFQSNKLDRYSLILFQLILSLASLKQGDMIPFYNRSNMLRQLVLRTLKIKSTAPIDHFSISQIISLKEFKANFVNPLVFNGSVIISMMFQITNDLNSSIDTTPTMKIYETSLKMSREMGTDFQAIVDPFFKTSEKELILRAKVAAKKPQDSNYIVKVQSSDVSAKVSFSNRFRKKEAGLTTDRLSTARTSAAEFSKFSKTGVIFKEEFTADPSVVDSQMKKLKKVCILNKEKVLRNPSPLIKPQEEPLNQILTSEKSLQSLNNGPEKPKVFHSQRHSMTFGEEMTRERSFKETTGTKAFEWSKKSFSKALFSSRRFSYAKGPIEKSTKTLTDNFSGRSNQNSDDIARHIKFHSRYLTELQTFAHTLTKEICVPREFPEGVPRDGKGGIIIGVRKKKNAQSVRHWTGSGHKRQESEGILSPKFKPGNRIFESYDLLLTQRPSFQTERHDFVGNRSLTSERSNPALKEDSVLDGQTKHENIEPKNSKKSVEIKRSEVIVSSRPSSAKIEKIRSIYGAKTHKRVITQTQVEPLAEEPYQEGNTLELDPNQIDEIPEEVKDEPVPQFGEKRNKWQTTVAMLKTEGIAKHRSSSIHAIQRGSSIDVDQRFKTRDGQSKRRETTNMIFSESKSSSRPRISQFKTATFKRGSTLDHLHHPDDHRLNVPQTLNKVNQSYNLGMSKPIIESKNEFLDCDEKASDRDNKLGESMKSKASGGHSSSSKTQGPQKKARASNLRLPDAKKSDSEGFEDNTLKTPNQITPRGKAGIEFPKEGRTNRSISEKSSYGDGRKSSILLAVNKLRAQQEEERAKSSRRLTERHVKQSVYNSLGNLIQISEPKVTSIKEGSASKDEKTKAKTGNLKELEVQDLIEKLEYDSSSSQVNDDDQLENAANEKGAQGLLKDFKASNFKFLRLIKGAECLNRVEIKRRQNQTRMTFFVLHFQSLRYRGNRPRAERNASTEDLTELLTKIKNGQPRVEMQKNR
jgi:hypothetical protein